MSSCEGFVCTGCYYHYKLNERLMSIGLTDKERKMGEPDDRGRILDPRIREYLRRYPDPIDNPRGRHHVLESGVLDDEQRELSSTLHVLGVDNNTIRSALSRRLTPLRNIDSPGGGRTFDDSDGINTRRGMMSR